jgi:nitroreductase
MLKRAPMFILSLALLVASAFAAGDKTLSVEDVLAIKEVSALTWSPDGRWLAFTVSEWNKKDNRRDPHIHIMPADGGNSALYDDGRVAERILVAATALGLSGAIGWVRDYQQEEVRAALGLPEDRAVRTIVSLGHPTEQGARPKAAPGEARLPLEELVHWERWRES